MKRSLVFILFVLVSSSAHALSINIGGKVTQVHFWETHTGVLVVHENMINPDSCARSDQYILRTSHPYFKEIYSMLLSTHLATNPVRLGLEGCYEGFPSIRHIYSNR